MRSPSRLPASDAKNRAAKLILSSDLVIHRCLAETLLLEYFGVHATFSASNLCPMVSIPPACRTKSSHV